MHRLGHMIIAALGWLFSLPLQGQPVDGTAWQRLDQGKVEVFPGKDQRIAFDHAVVKTSTLARLRLVAGSLVLPTVSDIIVRVEQSKDHADQADVVFDAPETGKPQKFLLEVLDQHSADQASVLAKALISVVPRDVLAAGWLGVPIFISNAAALLEKECVAQKLKSEQLATDSPDQVQKRPGLSVVVLAETSVPPASVGAGQVFLCFTPHTAAPMLLESRPCGSGWLVLADRRLLDLVPHSPAVQAALIRACGPGLRTAKSP